MFDFDFQKLPDEMKEASLDFGRAIKRERLAKVQMDAWTKEHSDASMLLKVKEKDYGTISLRWDPEKNIMSPSLKEFKDDR